MIKLASFSVVHWMQRAWCLKILGMSSARLLDTTWSLAKNCLTWLNLWLDWFRISYIGSSTIIPFFFLLCAMWNLSKCWVPIDLARKWGIRGQPALHWPMKEPLSLILLWGMEQNIFLKPLRNEFLPLLLFWRHLRTDFNGVLCVAAIRITGSILP